MNYYVGGGNHPFHLSVGAVVLNKNGEVLCHHYLPHTLGDNENEHELHLLVRETIEPGETLEQALHRGMREETGASVKIKTYVGSIVSSIPREETVVEKTTVYFLCDLEEFDTTKRDANDVDSVSEVVFLPIDVLIEKMNFQKERFAKYQRTDLDEVKILTAVKNLRDLEKNFTSDRV